MPWQSRQGKLINLCYLSDTTLAREILRPDTDSQRVLAICGYSFGDSHINIEIESALRASEGRLTVVAFYAEEVLQEPVKAWHDDPEITERFLIYGKRGFWHGATKEVSGTDLPWWKFENVGRILGGER